MQPESPRLELSLEISICWKKNKFLVEVSLNVATDIRAYDNERILWWIKCEINRIIACQVKLDIDFLNIATGWSAAIIDAA